MAQYTVVKQNLEKLQNKIESLNKIAAKLDCQPITLTVGEEHVETVKLPSDNYYATPVEYDVVYVDVDIEGEAPQLNGWRFVATLQHTDEGNIVRTVPGEELPAEYRVRPDVCDHCNTNRYRKDTYVVANEENQFKQVGSTCLKDFTGHLSPQHHALIATFLADAQSTLDEWEGKLFGTAGFARVINLVSYVANTVLVVEQVGYWKSRTKADTEGGVATSTLVGNLMAKHIRNRAEDARVQEQHIAKAKEIIAAVRSELNNKGDSTNDYEWNLKVAIAKDYIEPRDAGIVCSIYYYYTRMLQEAKEAEVKAESPESQHIGEVKQRLNLGELEVVYYTTFEGYYGLTHLYKFVDEAGNCLTWFASSNQWLEVGDKVSCTATIKAHDEYKGEKQTIITRAKIQELE